MGFAKPKFWPFSVESVLIFLFVALVGFGIWSARKARRPAAITRTRVEQSAIYHAMEAYYRDGGQFTNEASIGAEELYRALVEGEIVYLEPPRKDTNVLVDPWGSPYKVWIEQRSDGGKTLWIRSKGPDRQADERGGDDIVTDFVPGP